jgi:hypothetical protein
MRFTISESEKKKILSLHKLINEQEFTVNLGNEGMKTLKFIKVGSDWYGYIVRQGQPISQENRIKVPKSSEIGFIYNSSTKQWTPNDATRAAKNLADMLYSDSLEGSQKGPRYIFLDEDKNTFVSGNISLSKYPKGTVDGNEIKLKDGVEMFFNKDYFNDGEFSKVISSSNYEVAEI